MNEEEKKTIEDINGLITIFETDNGKDFEATCLAQKEIALNLKTILNLIEKLQKENEGLKAKLEYKEYGDLDNVEFEKYINEIVETRTKELKEQLEEEQELNKIIKETRINKVLENNIEVKKLREENEELKADNYELNNRINDLLDNISVQKVKDMIEKYKKLSDKFYVKFLESDRYNTDIREKGIKCDAIILALEELIEESGEK